MGDMVVEELWDIQQYKNMYVFDKKYICIKRKQKNGNRSNIKMCSLSFCCWIARIKKNIVWLYVPWWMDLEGFPPSLSVFFHIVDGVFWISAKSNVSIFPLLTCSFGSVYIWCAKNMSLFFILGQLVAIIYKRSCLVSNWIINVLLVKNKKPIQLLRWFPYLSLLSLPSPPAPALSLILCM